MSPIMRGILLGIIPFVIGTVNCALSIERFPMIEPIAVEASKWSAREAQPVYRPSPNWLFHLLTGGLVTGYGIYHLALGLDLVSLSQSNREHDYDLDLELEDDLSNEFELMQLQEDIKAKEEKAIAYPKLELVKKPFDLTFTDSEFQKEPEIDFDHLILTHTFSTDSSKHMMIVAQSGAGKTTTLARLIHLINSATSGKSEFFVSSVKTEIIFDLDQRKGSDGLPSVIGIFNRDNITVLYQRIKNVCEILRQRDEFAQDSKKRGETINFSPLFLVMDEWQSSLSLIRNYDSKLADEIEVMVASIILLGREYNVILWVFSQDHQVQNLGAKVFNSGMKNNLLLCVLGSPTSRKSIKAALSGKFAIVDSEIGSLLLAKANSLMDKKRYVAYISSQSDCIVTLSEFDRHSVTLEKFK